MKLFCYHNKAVLFSIYSTSYYNKVQMLLLDLGSMSFKFIFHLGPIVDFRYASVKYFPFNVTGFLSMRAFISSLKLINNCSSVKSILPINACRFRPESTLNVTWPALAYFNLWLNYSNFTNVPTLAFGISPLGPRALPKCLILPTKSSVLNNLSN